MASEDGALDRRKFLAALSAAGGWLAVPGWPGQAGSSPRVDARSSAFYAHPDGALNLVRFSIDGVDAPAGRLRVYDSERRLLGTAGVLRRNGGLYGELWLPLERARQVVSELEAPGVRGPFRTGHELNPHRKWVIHLLSVVDPLRITDELLGLPSFRRAVRIGIYRARGIRLNLAPQRSEWNTADHLSFLETVAQRTALARDLGIQPGLVGTTDDILGLSSSQIIALSGAGVQVVAASDEGVPFRWIEGPDGSRLLAVSLPARSTPTELGFLQSMDAMASGVEQLLSTSPDSVLPASAQGTAVVTSGDLGSAADAIGQAVSEWNQRFAFPKIISGDIAALIRDVSERPSPPMTVITPGPVVSFDLPTRVEIEAMVGERRQLEARRSESIFGLLAGVLREDSATLSNIASRIPTLVPGTVVFNPSPFSRSEFVTLLDGTERVVTDIPGLGYAYFPDQPAAERSEWQELDLTGEIETHSFRIRLNAGTGSLESLVSFADGVERVQPGSIGLNAVASARLQRTSVSRLTDTATRLTMERWSQDLGTLRTTLTLYDRLPWLDIQNEAEAAGDRAVSYGFHFAFQDPRFSWEVPGGVEGSRPPIYRLDHLRWLRIAGRRDAILFAGLDAPPASVECDGSVLSHASRGTARYRIGLHGEYDSPDLPWQFGWGTTPMLTARAEARNAGNLPTYGAILDVERVGVAVLGISRSRISDSVVVYLQELQGLSRAVSLRAGLIGFRWAQQVDFLEREIGVPMEATDGSVAMSISGRGVVAVRLHGLELNRA